MIIAIDGPAASGKGTLARRLARHLGLPHLDTGLLYRAVARDMIRAGDALSDVARASETARALDIGGLADPLLRAEHMGEAASIVSAFEPVRAALLAFQRRFAGQEGGAVLDGRDIGTVVCPGADVKLFVTATAEERARRRFRELRAQGSSEDYEAVLEDIRRRDARDRARIAAPLKAAPGAILLDTTELDADGAFAQALLVVQAAKAA